MGTLSPRVTKPRIIGGLAFFLAAAAIMYVLGGDMRSLLLGAAIGIVLVGALAAVLRAADRQAMAKRSE